MLHEVCHLHHHHVYGGEALHKVMGILLVKLSAVLSNPPLSWIFT